MGSPRLPIACGKRRRTVQGDLPATPRLEHCWSNCWTELSQSGSGQTGFSRLGCNLMGFSTRQAASAQSDITTDRGRPAHDERPSAGITRSPDTFPQGKRLRARQARADCVQMGLERGWSTATATSPPKTHSLQERGELQPTPSPRDAETSSCRLDRMGPLETPF